MHNPNDLKLLEELLAKTRKGKLNWEVASDENEFVTSVAGEYAVVVRKSARYDNYWLALRDSDDNELMGLSWTQDDQEFSDLPELFELARRSALKVNRKVDDLIGHLSRL